MVLEFAPSLAVVPILVNAGAALFPALVAGVASAAALIFRPRALFGACRRHPGRVAAIASVGAVAAALIAFWPAAEPSAPSRRATAAPDQTDWARVAIEILRAERLAAIAAPIESAPAQAKSPDRLVPSDYRRGRFDGGAAPVELQVQWEHQEEYALFLSSPLAKDGRIYATWCLLDPPGSYGAVVCLDADTGQVIWLSDERGDGTPFKGIFSSPAISPDGRSIVVGQGLHPDANCDLICLDAATGQVRWTAPTELHIESSPAIADGIVVVGAGAIETGDDHLPSGNPGYVFAVDLETGRELWRHAVADPESSPAIADGVAYIGSGFNGQAVVALRLESDAVLAERGLSREVWRQPTPHPATGAITLDGDRVLVGCGNGDFVYAAKNPSGAVLAFDRSTGEPLWKAAMPDAVLGPIAVRNGLAICPVRNGEIVALDLERSGAVVWRQPFSANAPILAGTAVSEELIYATSADGYLGVLALADGSLLEKHYLNAPGKPGELGMTLSSPLVSGGRVYVGSETGGLRCYRGTSLRR